MALSILLLIDVIFVISQVAITAEYPDCDVALRMCGLDTEEGCVPLPRYIEQLQSFFEVASRSILVLFVIEIVLTCYAMGFWSYFSKPYNVFDTAIIMSSLALELMEGSQHHDTGLLVLGRAWRFVTLLQGFQGVHQISREASANPEMDEDGSHFEPLNN